MMAMHEILFRGKRKVYYNYETEQDVFEWVYGAYGNHTSLDAMIIDRPYPTSDGDLSALNFWTVDSTTVGQYTGLTDKNGTMIFEGDIVKHYNHSNDSNKFDIGYVFWDEEHLCFKRTCNDGSTEVTSCYVWKNCLYEVIGNIHDNPEMLDECEDEE